MEVLRELVTHPQLKNPVTRLRIPNEREHQLALLSEVRETLLYGKEPAKALADADRSWQEIDQKKDADTRRLEYRLSLGLSSSRHRSPNLLAVARRKQRAQRKNPGCQGSLECGGSAPLWIRHHLRYKPGCRKMLENLANR